MSEEETDRERLRNRRTERLGEGETDRERLRKRRTERD